MVQKPKNAEAFGLEATLHGIIVPTTRWPGMWVMGLNLPFFVQRCPNCPCHDVEHRLRRWTKPDNQAFTLNAVLDLTRSKSEDAYSILRFQSGH
jgi:hypothetical protein